MSLICPACEGSGVIDEGCTPDPAVMVEIRCPACRGAGEVWPTTNYQSLVYEVDACPQRYVMEGAR